MFSIKCFACILHDVLHYKVTVVTLLCIFNAFYCHRNNRRKFPFDVEETLWKGTLNVLCFIHACVLWLIQYSTVFITLQMNREWKQPTRVADQSPRSAHGSWWTVGHLSCALSSPYARSSSIGWWIARGAVSASSVQIMKTGAPLTFGPYTA